VQSAPYTSTTTKADPSSTPSSPSTAASAPPDGRSRGHFPTEQADLKCVFATGVVGAWAAVGPAADCWTLAEHAGDATPDGVQHLLHRAKWDADAVRDDVRAYVIEHLADDQAGAHGRRDGRPEEGHGDRRRPAPLHRHRRPYRERNNWKTRHLRNTQSVVHPRDTQRPVGDGDGRNRGRNNDQTSVSSERRLA
jgi:hypothetical protein